MGREKLSILKPKEFSKFYAINAIMPLITKAEKIGKMLGQNYATHNRRIINTQSLDRQ